MDELLLKRISEITNEEKMILNGTPLDRAIYSGTDDFVVSSERISGGKADITVRTHTRYTDFPLHRHNYLEMMIVLSGSITNRIGTDAITLGAGDILVMNKHVTHSVDRADTADLGVNIILPDDFIDSLKAELAGTVFSELAEQNSRADGSGIYLAFSAGENKRIANVIENLLYEVLNNSTNVQIKRYTMALLFDYLSEGSDSLLRIASRMPDRDGVRRATIAGYINTHYKTATLTELAGITFLSVPYLSKKITEYFGKSFKELLLDARMKKAAKLIRETPLPIGSIINSVGYENESYFHREFKAYFGKTPLAYRRSEAKTGENTGKGADA